MLHRVFSVLLVVAASALILTGCQGRESTETLREDADRAMHFGRHEEAIDAYYGILEQMPQDRAAHRGLGEASLIVGDYRTARTHLAVAYELSLTHPELSYEIAGLLAQAMEGMGDGEAAVVFLRDRAESTGGTGDYVRWGEFAQRQGDPDTAELAFKTAARIDDGQSVEPYLHLADLYENLGDTDSAVVRLRQAYGVDPNDQRVTDWLGRYLAVVGPSAALPPDH